MDIDELVAKKEEMRRRRAERMMQREGSEDSAGSKKRGRPKKGDVEVIKEELGLKVQDTHLLNTQSRRKRSKPLDSVDPVVRQRLTKLFEQCYTALEEATEEDEETETYRQRCELFMDLVSKRDYPLYYTMIKSPISMNMIKKRIHSAYYNSVADFRADFKLMFDNARTFNEEGSFVYEDANEMERILEAKLKDLCPTGEV